MRELRAGTLLVVAQVLSCALGSDNGFEALKGLQGKWAVRSEEGSLPIEVSYETGSKGSVVSEKFGRELSVFYREGGGLTMIHFCNAGNQPRLKLKESSAPGLLEFETFDVSNLNSPGADHVQRITYRIVDDKRVELEIDWLRNKALVAEKYSLNRI